MTKCEAKVWRSMCQLISRSPARLHAAQRGHLQASWVRCWPPSAEKTNSPRRCRWALSAPIALVGERHLTRAAVLRRVDLLGGEGLAHHQAPCHVLTSCQRSARSSPSAGPCARDQDHRPPDPAGASSSRVASSNVKKSNDGGGARSSFRGRHVTEPPPLDRHRQHPPQGGELIADALRVVLGLQLGRLRTERHARYRSRRAAGDRSGARDGFSRWLPLRRAAGLVLRQDVGVVKVLPEFGDRRRRLLALSPKRAFDQRLADVRSCCSAPRRVCTVETLRTRSMRPSGCS